MDSYIAKAFVVMGLLLAVAVLAEAWDMGYTHLVVTRAAADARLDLEAGGGVTPQVVQDVRATILAAGLDAGRLHVDGTAPTVFWGGQVSLAVRYDHSYAITNLLPNWQWQRDWQTWSVTVQVSGLSRVVPA